MEKEELNKVYTDAEFEADFAEFAKYTSSKMMNDGFIEPSYLIVIQRQNKIEKLVATNTEVSSGDKYEDLVKFGKSCRKSFVTTENPGAMVAIFMSHESWASHDNPGNEYDMLPHEDPNHFDAHTVVGYTVDGRALAEYEKIIIKSEKIVSKVKLGDFGDIEGAPKPLYDSFVSGFYSQEIYLQQISNLLFTEAKDKYFIRYRIVTENEGTRYVLGYYKSDEDRQDNQNRMVYASKVEKGQKLMDVLKIEIPPMLGSDKFDLLNFGKDGTAKDRYGNDLKRIILEVSVPYNSELDGKVYDDFVLGWVVDKKVGPF